ncbi:hypothetical protein B6N31_08970 [Dickeya fangzhongdai]|nr:hypothetical protein B6N31_08970 [Dickeya fangzhongdai]
MRLRRTHDKARFKRHLPLTTGWGLNCAADAVPSAFAFAVRATRDAFQTRHGLSRRPVAHPAKSPTSAQFLTPEKCFILYLRTLSAV